MQDEENAQGWAHEQQVIQRQLEESKMATFEQKDNEGALFKEEDKKSVSGCCIMVGGCRIHSHSRQQATPGLAPGESELIAASDGTKEAILVQHVLEFTVFK